MGSLVQGNLSMAKRTEVERQELANLPGNYFKTLKSDFSNIFELAGEARQKFAGKIDPQWESAFQKASREFQAEYEKSGKEQNSLMALGPILYGYLKSFYYGIAAPASKTIVKTTATGASLRGFSADHYDLGRCGPHGAVRGAHGLLCGKNRREDRFSDN